MKCPICASEGHRSLVYPGVSSTTLMMGLEYYDEAGRFHDHNPNTTTREYRCSQGHHWTVKGRMPCPTCSDPVAELRRLGEDG